MNEAVTLFLTAGKGLKTPETLHWYQVKLGRLVTFVKDDEVDTITLDRLREWRAMLFESGLAAETADGYLRATKTLFRWLHQEGHITSNPAERLERPKRPDVPPKRINREHALALLRAAQGLGRLDGRDHRAENVRDYALVRFFLFTGARLSGVLGLRVGDISIAEGTAWVYEKGKKSRRVYFDSDTGSALAAWLKIRPTGKDVKDWVWVSPSKKRRLTRHGVRQVLRRLCERAGIPEIGPHTLRHTMAYESVARGVDADLLRQQLGHADVSTTYNSYVRWSDEDRRKAFSESWLPPEAEPRRPLLRVVNRDSEG